PRSSPGRPSACRCPGRARPRRCAAAAAAGSRAARCPGRSATAPGPSAGRSTSPTACHYRPAAAPAGPTGQKPGATGPAPRRRGRGPSTAGGENARLQEGAAALIDQAQPAGALAVAQAELVGGVHLPDVVGQAGPAGVAAGPRPRPGGGQLLLPEPAQQ